MQDCYAHLSMHMQYVVGDICAEMLLAYTSSSYTRVVESQLQWQTLQYWSAHLTGHPYGMHLH